MKTGKRIVQNNTGSTNAWSIPFAAFFIFVLSVSPVCSQTWYQAAPFPGTARDDGAAFTVGDVAYFGTGLEVGWQPTRDFYSFSTTEGWSQIASLAEGLERQYACGCADGSYGYLFGGVGYNSTYYNDLWRYDPTADTWTAMAPLPGGGRSGVACFALPGKLYIVGGRFADNTYTAETWTYSTTSDTWEQIADYPGGPVWRMQAGVHGLPGDRAAFVSTGLQTDGSFHGACFAFLEATNGWSGALGGLPGGGRMYASMGTYFNKAALFGGQDSGGNFLNDFWSWEWNGLLWEELNPLPSFERRGGMMTSLGPHLIYTTGLNANLERLQETWSTDISVSTNNPDRELGIVLYPNPGRDGFRMEGNIHGQVGLRIYSLDGKCCHTTQTAADGAVSLSHLPKGMYIVEITTARGEVVRKKWVKE